MSNPTAACSPFEADLSALLDGELAPERAAAVQDHLDGCADCSERYRALCAVDLALAELPVAAVPADLRHRLDQRIAADAAPEAARPPGPRGAAPAPRRRGLSRRALFAGLAAAAAVALYVAVHRGGRPPVPDAGRIAPPLAITTPAAPPAAAPPPSGAVESPTAVARDAGDARGAAAAPPTPAAELAGASDEELAVLLELETIEDLELIANLDLLERMIALEEGARG